MWAEVVHYVLVKVICEQAHNTDSDKDDTEDLDVIRELAPNPQTTGLSLESRTRTGMEQHDAPVDNKHELNQEVDKQWEYPQRRVMRFVRRTTTVDVGWDKYNIGKTVGPQLETCCLGAFVAALGKWNNSQKTLQTRSKSMRHLQITLEQEYGTG
jgi:hypothetical protein